MVRSPRCLPCHKPSLPTRRKPSACLHVAPCDSYITTQMIMLSSAPLQGDDGEGLEEALLPQPRLPSYLQPQPRTHSRLQPAAFHAPGRAAAARQPLLPPMHDQAHVQFAGGSLELGSAPRAPLRAAVDARLLHSGYPDAIPLPAAGPWPQAHAGGAVGGPSSMGLLPAPPGPERVPALSPAAQIPMSLAPLRMQPLSNGAGAAETDGCIAPAQAQGPGLGSAPGATRRSSTPAAEAAVSPVGRFGLPSGQVQSPLEARAGHDDAPFARARAVSDHGQPDGRPLPSSLFGIADSPQAGASWSAPAAGQAGAGLGREEAGQAGAGLGRGGNTPSKPPSPRAPRAYAAPSAWPPGSAQPAPPPRLWTADDRVAEYSIGLGHDAGAHRASGLGYRASGIGRRPSAAPQPRRSSLIGGGSGGGVLQRLATTMGLLEEEARGKADREQGAGTPRRQSVVEALLAEELRTGKARSLSEVLAVGGTYM